MIYLDNAATTGQKPEGVIDAVTEAMRSLSVNAGRGSYAAARKAVQIIEECKSNLFEIGRMNAGYHVYFAPSATIALNQIILGEEFDCYSNIYVTPFEHNAVMRPLNAVCTKTNAKLRALHFNREDWSLDTADAEAAFLAYPPKYVFLSMVSNTTGYVLPVKEIVDMAHTYGAKVIVDCAQAFGAVNADLSAIGADAYVFASHKTLYGPYGIAGFIVKDTFSVSPGLFGGTGSDSLNLVMPSANAGGLEPGSANIPAICGLNEAVKWLQRTGVQAIQAHESGLVGRLVEGLQRMEKLHLYVPPTDRHSGIVAFTVDGYQSHDVGEILDDEFDIAVRTGYQCAPLVHDWLGSKPYGGIVRASVSYFNTKDDMDCLIEALKTL
ncbi:MAG: aminotransferase class V-fold PLP-dependent enzyme [Eubacteriales bacterium]|nr:aminotransferase class V-fold PLP-dependent enzyme [Eubacteriales bacterium]